jgi:hypothetical protein
MSEKTSSPRPGHASRSGGDDLAVVPSVPQVDEVPRATPPWTVPEPYDEAMVRRPELVAPMKSPCRLAEVSGTDAPRLVRKRDAAVSEDEKQ